MNRTVFSALILLLFVCMSGCSPAEKTAAAGPNPEAVASPEAIDPGPGSTAKPTVVRIPRNTLLHVRLLQTISSGSASSGDQFDAELATPLKAEGSVAFPRGAQVHGRVAEAKASGRLHDPGFLRLTLTAIQDPGGKWLRVSTTSISARGKGHGRRNLTLIGGGAGVGALIGGLAGGGKGAAIGVASGAAAGTAGAYATGKKDVRFAAESKLTFKTLQELEISR